MAYDNAFYLAYEAYLAEPTVRQAHDWVFNIARAAFAFGSVIDLGCGQSSEYLRFANPLIYVGVDLNEDAMTWRKPKHKGRGNVRSLQMNYRGGSVLDSVLRDNQVTAFVSLFSSEITAPPEENYKLYRQLFKNEGITAGLVSGFYYRSKKDQPTVAETGGITSYQTIEEIGKFSIPEVIERRIVLSVPSKMFGADVIEIWKFFERQP